MQTAFVSSRTAASFSHSPSSFECLLGIEAFKSFLFRAHLLESAGQGPLQPAQETERTAELDNQGLLQMQRQVMQEQNTELEELEKAVGSTKVLLLSSPGNARPSSALTIRL